MKKLDKELFFQGFKYKQIKRNDFKAIYEQYLNDGLVAYEVFYIPKHDGFIIKDKIVEPKEFYPKNEYFGTTAWTLKTEKKALKKYNKLNKIE